MVCFQCVRQYSEAYVLLHGLCQQARDVQDQTELNKCQLPRYLLNTTPPEI